LAHVLVLVVVALVAAAGLSGLLWLLLGRPPIRASGPWTTADTFDALKIVLSVIAGIGGIVALTVAYRRQHLGEAGDRREDAKHFADRYAKNAEMLGSDKSSVRLAAIYALAALADDWTAGRQTCVDVLCAYLRMPCDPLSAGSTAQPGSGAAEEQQIRHTVIRVIVEHLRLPERHPRTWAPLEFDFTGAVFDGDTDFSSTSITGRIRFDQAQVTGTFTVACAVLGPEATLSFRGTRFLRGQVHLTLSGAVCFERAQIADAAVEVTVPRQYARGSGDAATAAAAILSGKRDVPRTALTFTDAVVSGGSLRIAADREPTGRPAPSDGAPFEQFIDVDLAGAQLADGRIVIGSDPYGPLDFTEHAADLGAVGWRLHFLRFKLQKGTVAINDVRCVSVSPNSGQGLDFSRAELTGGDLVVQRLRCENSGVFHLAQVHGTRVTFHGLSFVRLPESGPDQARRIQDQRRRIGVARTFLDLSSASLQLPWPQFDQVYPADEVLLPEGMATDQVANVRT
jgi:hypothetical protein